MTIQLNQVSGPAPLRLVTLCVMTTAIACGLARGQDRPAAPEPPATRPAYPALDQLNRESIALHERLQLNREVAALYERLQGGVVRVQLPSAQRAGQGEQSLEKKWPNLAPEVRSALNRRQGRGGGGTAAGTAGPNNSAAGNSAVGNSAAPDARPTVQQADGVARPEPKSYGNTANSVEPSGRGQRYTILVPPSQNGSAPLPNALTNDGQQLQPVASNGAAGTFAPNAVGLLLDGRGHVLLPTYVEREAVADQVVRLAVGAGGDPVTARFVGSDEQTQLTVLQCSPPVKPDATATSGSADEASTGGATKAKAAADKRAAAAAGDVSAFGQPVTLGRRPLAEGAVVVVLSPIDGTGRLAVWANGGARENGVVVAVDGEVAGIARAGQFLSGSACGLIADQIIRHGAVRRATLGVIVVQVGPADPDRQGLADLGERPAVRVSEVMAGSPAARAGLRPGDLILALAGEPVQSIPSLAAAVAARNGPTELTVLRDGKALTVSAELAQK